MPRLPFSSYLDHIRDDSARFRAALADADPTARVPACPDWDAGDLLWHLAGVQWFWSQVITSRPAGPQDDWEAPERPESWPGLLAAYDKASAGLTDALAAADPAEPAWSWADDKTVGFTYRRQAHEALIHRLDAEQAAGAVTPLDPTLAADGVAELMEVMYGGEPPEWAQFTPGEGAVAVEMTDVGQTIVVRPGHLVGTDPESGDDYDGPHLVVVEDEAPVATIAGAAADLDAWLWRRRDDAGITVTGDEGAYDRFRAAVSQPLD